MINYYKFTKNIYINSKFNIIIGNSTSSIVKTVLL